MKHKLFDLFQYFFLQLQRVSLARRLFVLTVIAVIPWFIIFFWPDNLLHIYFFNVGQGDSIFIKTPNNYQILIDGGPDEKVLTELGKVMPFYDHSLDLVFLSHPHADHVTGLIEVLKRFSVGQVLVNDIVYETDEYQTFLSLIESKGVPKQSFLQGDKIKLSDGIKLTSFWPKAQTNLFEILDINKVSQVVRLDFSQFSALFTGDAELGVENPELANFAWDEVDVLKVSHQGSKEAVTKEVLGKLKPELAVISVGENKFGHPSEEVIRLLSNQDIKVVRTDKEGTIEVVSDGTDLKFEIKKKYIGGYQSKTKGIIMYYRKHKNSALFRIILGICLFVGVFWVMKNPDIFTKQLESVGAGSGQVLGTFFEQLGESARQQVKRAGERFVKLKTQNSKLKTEEKILFKFAVVADSHEDETSFPMVLERIKGEEVDFLIHLGDLVNAGELEKLKQAKSFLDNTGISYYVIPGDHDYNWQPEHSLANFKEVFGAEQIYASFEYNDVFFILLDNSNNSNEVEVTQTKWLQEQLSAISNQQSAISNVFIFCHKPLSNPYFPDKVDANGRIILELFVKYNVDQVFSGNVHTFARYPDSQTGIGITTVGAAGTYKNPLPQYVLVTVYENGSFDVEAKPYKELKLAK